MSTTDSHDAAGRRTYVTIAEIAPVLGVPHSTIRYWAAGGGVDFPPVARLPNRALLLDLVEVECWWTRRYRGGHRAGNTEVTRRLLDPTDGTPVPSMNTINAVVGGEEAHRFFTLAEFAAYIRQSPHTVGKWLRRGGRDFPKYIRLPNGSVLVERVSADRWLRERTS